MVYVPEKTKRMNSVLPCDPICKPSSPLDKSTQAGKSLITSRANPNFCVFCNKRHAGISCSSVNPVTSSDADYIPPQAAHLPPSKCKDCIVLDVILVSSTILDGIRQTVTHKKTKLCPVHLQPDSTPPPIPDPILDFPALQLSDSATEDLLQRIQTEEDPLAIMDASSPPPDPTPPAAEVLTTPPPPPAADVLATPPPPAAEVLSTPPPPAAADEPTPPPPAADVLPTPPPPVADRPGPSRRARSRTVAKSAEVETKMQRVYPQVLRDVNSGMSLNKAIQTSSVTRSSFFKYRFPVEMRIVDATHYEHLRQQCYRNSTKLSDECRSCLTDEDSPYFLAAQQKRADKEILPLNS